ncbi:sigma-70 family RNA polymerase sigma factor [Tundrisphaera lichenicola]|uniref:sigma-70 family RNA polymerase sigma factor n=1 Tax=Tundrisphaera lichenicola TaxID=2029860 RepID=UPI003EB8DD70
MASATVGSAYRHLRDLFGGRSVVGLGDGQLLRRYASSKDGAAFEALVGRHGPLVLSTCRAVLRSEHDVEDAFQATFLVLARKAGSVQGVDSLGGWLHRVAFRASLRLAESARRRRRKEAEASAMTPEVVSQVRPDPELKPILHEEIDRLPESQRLPVVLCDLEGLSYEQAADQLGWTVPSFRCRLARGRQKLRDRLIRRGIAAPAVALLLAGSSATGAVVPALLIRSTVAMATGGVASAGVVALTQIILRGMLMTKIQIGTTALLAVLGLSAAGVIASGAGRNDEPKPASPPEARSRPATPATQVAEKLGPMEMVEIRGRVVAADGKPVAGANLRGAYVDRNAKPLPGATSGPDGRFAIRLPRPKDQPSGYMANFPWIIASAPGHGIGWAERVLRSDRPDEQVVTLTEEGPPIEGRIIDLEGRPVAGASVKLAMIWFEGKGDLAGWIARARNGAAGNLWQGLDQLSLEKILPIEAQTDAEGRFKLAGIGRDRIADLIVSGPGIATTPVNVFSREEKEIRSSDKGMMSPTPFIVHAPKFQLALAPSKGVEGVVRDKETGKPIVGLKINAAVFDDHSLIQDRGIEAETDAEGHYRLDGLPKAAAYRLFLSPGPGLPYSKGTLKAPADSPALEPVAFDFKLKSGVIVRGKVTDKATGRPVRGYAHYYAFADNPNVDDYPGFRSSYNSQADINQEDGSFELVALPGRGVVGVRAEEERHKGAVGDEKIAGYDAKMKTYNTLPSWCNVGNYHIIAEVNIDPKAKPPTLELQADPGQSVAVEVVGPDGQPLGGTKVKGKSELFQSSPFPEESASFEIHALEPAHPRRIVVIQEDRKLIGSAFLRGDEPGPVAVKLQPWGRVAGRIIDDEGKPRKGMFIGSPGGSNNPHPETHDILPGSDWNQGIRVGDDGRFEIEGLVPGLKYSANARTGFEAYGDLFIDVTVEPGEVKGLGDLKVQPPKKTEE